MSNNIWQWFGGVTVIVIFEFWLQTQKAPISIFEITKSPMDSIGASIFGLFIGGLMLIIFLINSIIYARMNRYKPRDKRIPPVWGHQWPRISFFVYYLLPVVGIIHFLDKMLAGTVTKRATSTTPEVLVISTWEEHLFAPTTQIGQWVLQFFSEPNMYSFNGGYTFFPFIESWAGVVVVMFNIILFFIFLKLYLTKTPFSNSWYGQL